MRSVLIIDDDDDIRASLCYLLESEGYMVHSARNGKEALDLLLRMTERPGLTLVDLLMPVMDGVEFLAQIEKHAELASLPMAVLSAASTVRPPGKVQVLRKPVALDDLLALVAEKCGPPR